MLFIPCFQNVAVILHPVFWRIKKFVIIPWHKREKVKCTCEQTDFFVSFSQLQLSGESREHTQTCLKNNTLVVSFFLCVCGTRAMWWCEGTFNGYINNTGLRWRLLNSRVPTFSHFLLLFCKNIRGYLKWRFLATNIPELWCVPVITHERIFCTNLLSQRKSERVL